MKSLRFGTKVCRFVRILLKDANARISVNGELSSSFDLQISVKQGCHLAPSLFVIVADTICYVLRYSCLRPPIKGLSPLNNDSLIKCQFADHRVLFPILDEKNV